MCFEDVQLGRESNSGEFRKTVTTTGAGLVSNAPGRIAIIFGTPSGNNVRISTEQITTFEGGIILTTSGSPLILDIQHHGDLVRKAWNAISTGGDAEISIMEVFLDRGREQD